MKKFIVPESIKPEVTEPLELNSGIQCDNCRCYNGQEDHTCPFSEEINDDKESMCNCCENCTHQCAIDIL